MDSESYLQIFSNISLTTPSVGVVIAMIITLMLLFMSGFVSASEIAFFSLAPTDLNKIEEGDSSTDKRIITLRSDSERLLATILIANNFVNVLIIMLCNYIISYVLHFGVGSEVAEFVFTTVILTFLLLLFGEIMPKIYSAQHTLSFCRIAAPAISLLRTIFYPFSSLLVHSSFIAEKVASKESHSISVEELDQALELTDKKEIAEERNMLKGIIRFGDETVKEVLTSRLDVVDLEMSTPFNEVLKCIVENNYSRIPVYLGNKDNIKGVLYIKDLLPHLGKPNNFRWQSLIRPPFFVPDAKKIDDLLRDFQANKVHIAIVVDEFGGTSGIVTMEDIIEEIVGEINDEYDEENALFVKIKENVYIFEAKVMLSDFYRILKLEDDVFEDAEGDADTLAGLLLELKGEFPKVHEVIPYKNFDFEILEMNDRRILKVKVTIKSAAEGDKPKSKEEAKA